MGAKRKGPVARGRNSGLYKDNIPTLCRVVKLVLLAPIYKKEYYPNQAKGTATGRETFEAETCNMKTKEEEYF